MGWIKSNREIRDYLTMNGYGDLFLRNAIEPVQGHLTVEAWTTKKESWTNKQERACAVIRNRLGYNGRQTVVDVTTVSTMMEKIKDTLSTFWKRRFHLP